MRGMDGTLTRVNKQRIGKMPVRSQLSKRVISVCHCCRQRDSSMRLRLAIVLLFCGALPSLAATLKGNVLANELGGAPVRGATVSAAGASPTETGESGDFTLIFPSLAPGDPVQLTVSKPGKVVVNSIQLRMILPKNPESEVATFLLCKEDEREEWTRVFYRIKSLAAVDTKYKQQIKKLPVGNTSSSSERIALIKERDQARVIAEKAADETSPTKPGDDANLYSQAIRLFLAGDVRQALDVLNPRSLQKSLEKARKQKAEANGSMQEAVQVYLLRASILTTQFQFSQAETLYKSAVQAAPESFEANYAFASFSQGLNKFGPAEAAYQKALQIAQVSDNAPRIAMALNDLANIEVKQNQRPEARIHYENALQLRTQLSQKDPYRYLPLVGETLNNLGNLDSDEGKFDAARQNYKESLRLREQLIEQGRNIFLPNVAMTLSNLGLLERDENNYSDARSFFERAVQIYDHLVQTRPGAFSPDLAGVLNNLALLDRAEGRVEDARLNYRKALGVYKDLATENPSTYLPNVALIQNNFAVLDQQQGFIKDARGRIEEALRIRKSLSKENPGAYESDLAVTLVNIGALDVSEGRLGDARDHFGQAFEIYLRLARKDRAVYLGSAALTENNLARLDVIENKKEAAISRYHDVIKMYRELSQTDSARYSKGLENAQSALRELEGEVGPLK